MTRQRDVGSMEKQISLLAQGLSERNIDTSAWYLIGGAGHYHKHALKYGNVRVIRFGIHGDRKIYRDLPNFDRIGGVVADFRREHPNSIYAFRHPSYVVAAPAARMAGVPVVVARCRRFGNLKTGRPGVAALECLATRATAPAHRKCGRRHRGRQAE